MGRRNFKADVQMRPRDRDVARRLEEELLIFDQNRQSLVGIRDPTSRAVFIEQLIESTRRIMFVTVLRSRDLSDKRRDPAAELFDPLRAAILCQRSGDLEEAFWLVFLFVHFGKHPRSGWRYVRDIYGRLGDGELWDWPRTSTSPSRFRAWLYSHQRDLRPLGVPHGFGNHRKRESLDAYSSGGTGAVVESYVAWVRSEQTHEEMMGQSLEVADGDPKLAFDHLYRSMDAVTRFGRLARFDYLTMVGKLGLAPIAPGSTYLKGSTGPLAGAHLLFGGNYGVDSLDSWLVELAHALHIEMQAVEDALCNWQKSPRLFKPFRG